MKLKFFRFIFVNLLKLNISNTKLVIQSKYLFYSRSNKLKPFWLSITEKETLPVLDFLSAALLSVEYDRALSRALAITECPVVPFFGAFLRELREILSTTSSHEFQTQDHAAQHAHASQRPSKSDSRRERDQHQQRQVVGWKFYLNCVVV